MAKFDDIVKSHSLVLVDFYADWCQPCKAMAPVFEELKENMGDGIKIVKIDVEKNDELAYQFQIRSIPTLAIFKDGEQVWKEAGALQFPELQEVINKFGK